MKAHNDLLTKYETLIELYENNRNRIEVLEWKIKDAQSEKGNSHGGTYLSTEKAQNVTSYFSVETKQEDTEENFPKGSLRIIGTTGQGNTQTIQVRDVDQPIEPILDNNDETVDEGGTKRSARNVDVPENIAFSAYLDKELTHLQVGHIVA